MEETLLIPVLAIICAIGMPVLFAIMTSYMLIRSKHEEKMAMIEKGIVLEEAVRPERKPNRYNALRNGILMVGLSLGVVVGMLANSVLAYDDGWPFLVIVTSTVLFGGISFVAYFFISRSLMEKENREDERKMMRLEE